MLRPLEGRKASYDPALRGYQPIYRMGEVNRCPGCGRTHWYVGRISAECGFCGTALALADGGMTGVGLLNRPHLPHAPRFDEAA